MTKREKKTLNISGKLWNSFRKLPVIHIADTPEFQHHLHALQNIILARPAYKKHVKK